MLLKLMPMRVNQCWLWHRTRPFYSNQRLPANFSYFLNKLKIKLWVWASNTNHNFYTHTIERKILKYFQCKIEDNPIIIFFRWIPIQDIFYFLVCIVYICISARIYSVAQNIGLHFRNVRAQFVWIMRTWRLWQMNAFILERFGGNINYVMKWHWIVCCVSLYSRNSIKNII